VKSCACRSVCSCGVMEVPVFICLQQLQPCDRSRTIRSVLKYGCNPTILQILFLNINACRNLFSTHDMYGPIVFGS
jgi:hypothetical protein